MNEDKMIRNQGMSLVELLVSVAVLGIAMIGILSLINLSTKYYSNSSKEVEVQSELQTTFAMVSNMLVDANAGVTFTSSSKKAVIANRTKKYVVQLSGTKLYAKAFNAAFPLKNSRAAAAITDRTSAGGERHHCSLPNNFLIIILRSSL